MKDFLIKLFSYSLIGLVPIILVLISYVYLDPYKVVNKYDDYSSSKVGLNRDFISMESFNNRRKKRKYNSFILGSSRTLGVLPSSWSKYIDDTNSEIFVFDASSETLKGIEQKLIYIDSLDIEIDNLLIILCNSSWYPNNAGQLSRKHYLLTGESYLNFQWVYFNAFLNPAFMKNYYQYTLFGTCSDGFLNVNNIIYDSITNHMIIKNKNDLLDLDSNKYYNDMAHAFNKQNGETIDKKRLTPNFEKSFLNIKKILDKHKTLYKIIIPPLFSQIKLNSEDKKFLDQTFEGCVYDFSGDNEITRDRHNYYEAIHFRPKVGDVLLKEIYKN